MQTSPNTEFGFDTRSEGNVIHTRSDTAIDWLRNKADKGINVFRKNSLWPMPMGLACCAIELMAAGASRFDIARFGAEVMRFSPRQSDVMIVAGTVTYKMALAVKRIYDQMAEPKWVIAMGACASTGGMYRSYAVLQGVDQILPVDVYVAGCPPRPEALLDALIRLQNKVAKEPVIATQKKGRRLKLPVTSGEIAIQLKAQFGDLISGPAEFRGELTVTLADAERIADVCAALKKNFGFDYLVDISSIDNYGDDPRWTVVYHFYGYGHGQNLRLKTSVSEEKSELPTVTTVWRTADWHEREIYDMMGIRFRGHPDLRRILMWEGYPYFPLRKDFPLAGKSSDLPEVGFSKPAPMAGGPFVTIAGGKDTIAREPRIRIPETDALATTNRVERRADIKDAHGEGKGPGPIEPKK